MARRLQDDGASVNLFPFLSILVCIIGCLTLIIVVVNLIAMSNPELEDFSFADCEEQMLHIENLYAEAKGLLLQAGAELKLPVQDVIDTIEQNSRMRRMPRQMLRAMRYLSELSMVAEVRDPDEIEQVEAEAKSVIHKAEEEKAIKEKSAEEA